MSKMKYVFLSFLLAMLVSGCSDEHKEVQIPFSTKQLEEVNKIIEAHFNDIASCAELAKCLGLSSGDLHAIPERSYVSWNGNSYSMNLLFSCDLQSKKGVVQHVGLVEIGPMLAGCRGRDCSKVKCSK